MKMTGECIATAGLTWSEVADQMQRFLLRASQAND
jgi:hypothetical protein